MKTYHVLKNDICTWCNLSKESVDFDNKECIETPDWLGLLHRPVHKDPERLLSSTPINTGSITRCNIMNDYYQEELTDLSNRVYDQLYSIIPSVSLLKSNTSVETVNGKSERHIDFEYEYDAVAMRVSSHIRDAPVVNNLDEQVLRVSASYRSSLSPAVCLDLNLQHAVDQEKLLSEVLLSIYRLVKDRKEEMDQGAASFIEKTALVVQDFAQFSRAEISVSGATENKSGPKG